MQARGIGFCIFQFYHTAEIIIEQELHAAAATRILNGNLQDTGAEVVDQSRVHANCGSITEQGC